MSELENEVVSEETPETTPEVETPSYSGPSAEEFEAMKSQIEAVTGIVPSVQQMSQILQQITAPEEDPEELDIGQYIQQEIQRGLAPIMPIVTTAGQEAGKKRMTEIFSEHEKTLGKFDHVLAEKASVAYFNETGNPVKAVEEGAKYAAEYRKQEREAAVAEYKASLKRPGPGDFPVEGGGDRTIKPAKTYDEVVERWAGQTEV